MTGIITYIMAHGADVVTILTYTVALASAVANLTPTQTDNVLVGYMSKIVNFLALNIKK